MTSTPVSLQDESLNGSWIDIHNESQIDMPGGNDSPEFLAAPRSMADSVQNLGLISFQVERFLQEAQRNRKLTTSQHSLQPTPGTCGDDNSGIYSSDTDLSIEASDTQAIIDSLRRLRQGKFDETVNADHNSRSRHWTIDGMGLRLPAKGEDWQNNIDQLSDSLSLLSRASAAGEPPFGESLELQDFDWLWDWTSQPEYFTGQEWKVHTPKQDYLMRQRQLYSSSHNQNGALFSGEVVSLLFLTNILSIIIGAGLTYSILMRRSAV